MSSRKEILDSIRLHTKAKEERPSMANWKGITYEDKTKQFIAISQAVGGDAIVLKDGEDINDVIKSHYPDAQRIASVMPEITCATYNPDTVQKAAELNDTDVAVIEGVFGVCENGCVWIEQTMEQRAICFISENLVIVIPKDALVNNMHEGYARVQPSDKPFRGFISGPSKTADIEQALVIGAHGARSALVILR
ncbi:hypothetical protein HR11_07155 [Porphyromonas macacae]|uniref:LutC/YkgG family protein n=1 Tax=Porphyromonas macacae TaxID=28115 RepID=UPI00052DE83B|nr:LUD domain-containing protein [Porphyromonas macacae]KGN99967.1 hypothetical protein HR11_07155 [Porphyromonas macacae]